MPSSQELMADWFQKTAELTETTLKATARLQQEALDQWMEAMVGSNFARDWPQRAQSLVANILPTAQKSAREYLEAIDHTYDKVLELIRDCFQSGKAEHPAELQKCLRNIWKDTLGTLRSNNQTFMRANTKALNQWADFVFKNPG